MSTLQFLNIMRQEHSSPVQLPARGHQQVNALFPPVTHTRRQMHTLAYGHKDIHTLIIAHRYIFFKLVLQSHNKSLKIVALCILCRYFEGAAPFFPSVTFRFFFLTFIRSTNVPLNAITPAVCCIFFFSVMEMRCSAENVVLRSTLFPFCPLRIQNPPWQHASHSWQSCTFLFFKKHIPPFDAPLSLKGVKLSKPESISWDLKLHLLHLLKNY